MRGFLKFIVVIIVICVIAGTLYFFLTAGNKYNETHKDISGDNQSGEVSLPNGEEDKGNNSSDQSGENNSSEELNNNSGDIYPEVNGDLEAKIDKINTIESENRLGKLVKSFEESVGMDIIGTSAKDYFQSFEVDTVGANIQVTENIQGTGSMVYIIPAPDFFNNAQYHYDSNGNLILYVCELTGVGGEMKYYYDNGELIAHVNEIEEDIMLTYEDADEILTRATIIYAKYVNTNTK